MRFTKIKVSVVACLSAALLLTAIPAGIASASTSPKATSHTLASINVVEAGSIPSRLSLYVALYAGLFKKFGLDVHLVEAASGSQAATLLAGNTAQFEFGQVSDALNDVLAGVPVSGLAMVTQREQNAMIIAPKYYAAIKKEGLKALAGLPIGITGVGSGTWAYAELLGSLAGLTGSQLNLVSIGSNQVTDLQDFLSGRVAAEVLGDPVSLQVTGSKKGDWVADEENVTHGITSRYPALVKLAKEPFIFDWAFTTKTYAASHQVIVQDFVDALVEAQNYILHESPVKVGKLITQDVQFAPFGVGYLTEAVQRMVVGQGVVTSVVPSAVAFNNAKTYQTRLNSAYAGVQASTVINATYAKIAKKKVGNKY